MGDLAAPVRVGDDDTDDLDDDDDDDDEILDAAVDADDDDRIPDPAVIQLNIDALKLAMGVRPEASVGWSWDDAQERVPRNQGLTSCLSNMKRRLMAHFGGDGTQLSPEQVEGVRIVFGRCFWNIAAAVFLNLRGNGFRERSPLQQVDYLRCANLIPFKAFFQVGDFAFGPRYVISEVEACDTGDSLMFQWLYENAYGGDLSSADYIALTEDQKQALYQLCSPIRRDNTDNLVGPRELLGMVERLMFNLHNRRVPSYGEEPAHNATVTLNLQFMDRLVQEALAIVLFGQIDPG